MTASPTNFSTKPPYCSMASASIVNRSFWKERTSSGSSRSLSDVNPDTSANSTVTSRRSASTDEYAGAGRTGELAAVGAGVGLGFASSDAPHFGQKRKSGAQANPQAAHWTGKRRPHFGQKAKPGAVSKLQSGQFTQLASWDEAIPESSRRGDRQLDVVFQQIPGMRQRSTRCANALEVLCERRVALFDGKARITRGLTFGPGPRKRDGRAGEDQQLLGAADLGMPRVPARVSGNRHGKLGQHDARDFISVVVYRRHERPEGAARRRRHGGPVEPPRLRMMPRVGGVNAVKNVVEPFGRDRRTVANGRVSARWRLDPVDDPAVEMHQTGAQQERVVDDTTEVPGVIDGTGRIGRRKLSIGRRPDAEAVLGAGEMIDPDVRSVRDVDGPVRIGVGQRRIAAMVLGRRVRVEDAEATPARVHSRMERVLHTGVAISGGLIGEGKEVGHHVVAVLRVLSEALVELAAHAARDVRDDPVERLPATLVKVQVLVHERAQEPARLRAPVRIGPAKGARRRMTVT